jgi:hypothetical protein
VVRIRRKEPGGDTVGAGWNADLETTVVEKTAVTAAERSEIGADLRMAGLF